MPDVRPSSGDRAVLVHEIPWRDPITVLPSVADRDRVCFLDSARENDPRAQYSYLGIDPFQVIETRDGVTRVDGCPVSGDALAVLARLMATYTMPSQMPSRPGPVPFLGGAMGFWGYELGWQLENLPPPPPGPGLPQMVIGIYDTVLAFDHRNKRAYIICTDPRGEGGGVLDARCRALVGHLAHPVPPLAPVPALDACWQPDLSRATYCRRVEAVLDHIAAGDLYQANFTEAYRLACSAPVDPVALHLALRRASPAPFAALVRCGPDLALVSASPERFVRLDPDGMIETRPIKGTARRDPDPARDRALAAGLVASEKDRAENLMIVDLLRNDLGRVAEIGSVTVPALARLETFPSVHHLVSVVEARLKPDLGPCDLLRATFPGGSVTGAPKIRAMEIIATLEAAKRGAYCGAIGWIGFDRAMDSSITIRTLTVTPDAVIAQAGGGIVADSDPAAEYDEMRVKIAPLLGVLGREDGA